jgi:replicative DNA helicase
MVIGNNLSIFSLKEHGLIYKEIFEMYQRGNSIDRVILKENLRKYNGESAKIHNALDYCINSDYLKDVKEACHKLKLFYARRIIHRIGERFIDNSHKAELDVFNLIDIGINYLKDFSNDIVKDDLPLMDDLIDSVYDEISFNMNNTGLTGIDTGFIDLNDKLGGYQAGDFIILAGRPSMGKTAFALNLAINACSQKHAKAFGSQNAFSGND